MTSAWGRLGTMERISVGLPQLDTSPSATSTASLNNMASTSSHFQGNGYGTSSSSVRILFILGPLFCESMFDDNVARSFTPSLTVPSFWYHPHSIQPSYLRPFLSSVHFHRHSSYAVLLSSHQMPVPVPHPILDFHCDFSHFRCLERVSFIPYPVDL